MVLTVKALNLCVKAVENLPESEEKAETLKLLDRTLCSVGYWEQARDLNPELWKEKTEAEESVQDYISEFYDEVYSVDNIKEPLVQALVEARTARDRYFDYAQANALE